MGWEEFHKPSYCSKSWFFTSLNGLVVICKFPVHLNTPDGRGRFRPGGRLPSGQVSARSIAVIVLKEQQNILSHRFQEEGNTKKKRLLHKLIIQLKGWLWLRKHFLRCRTLLVCSVAGLLKRFAYFVWFYFQTVKWAEVRLKWLKYSNCSNSGPSLSTTTWQNVVEDVHLFVLCVLCARKAKMWLGFDIITNEGKKDFMCLIDGGDSCKTEKMVWNYGAKSLLSIEEGWTCRKMAALSRVKKRLHR